jgi:cysteine-rich repeat protein
LVGCGDDTTGGGGEGGGQGGGDGGSGGEGGATNPVASDTCDNPGTIIVGQDETVSAQGSMEGSNDDYRMFCADSETMTALSYPEVVFAVEIQNACSATFNLEGQSGFDGVLGLRTVGCTEDEYCANSAPTGTEEIQTHLEAGTYHIIVSDAGDGTADFTVSVTCSTPVCADGVVNPGEECDDGNTAADDGCAADCTFEPSDPAIDTCAGATASDGTPIGTGELVLIPAAAPERSTVGATDSGQSTCQTGATTGPAPDHVYKIIPSANGTLIATLGLDFDGVPYCGETEPVEIPPGCWDRAVHIREAACDDDAAEVACADNAEAWWFTEIASAEVVAGTEYYVFVDGYNADEFGQGTYVLQVELN